MRELSNTIGQLQAREQELLTKLKLKVCYKILQWLGKVRQGKACPFICYQFKELDCLHALESFIKISPCPKSKLVEHNNTGSNYWAIKFC